nr:zinc finger, CCHC-type [Tanacetum cinerariifolium]
MITPYELWTKRKLNLNYLKVWGYRAVVRLPDPKLKTSSERGIECIFVRYAEHSKAFRLYVIEPNESVSVNSIIESRDAIFDENRFSSVPIPSLMISNGTEDIGGSVVPEEVTKEVATQQPEPELRKDKRNRTPKNFRSEFQLYLIEGTRDVVYDQHSYCFNVEDDLKIFNEAMKFHDVAFWKEAINDEIYHGQQHLGMDVKTTFLNGELDKETPKKWHQKFDEVVDLIKEFLSSSFSMQDMGEADVILMGNLSSYTSNPGTQHWQAIQRVPKYLKTTMDYSLIYTGYSLIFKGYTDASWICNTEDNSSTSSWVFLLGGGAISWASKKHTCITSLIMESNFVDLAAAGKEAEWLRNMILEIPLWSKPIAPIFILCDSAATLTKAYSQMYNGKSKHLGVMHSMIRELITNGGGMYRVCEVSTKLS